WEGRAEYEAPQGGNEEILARIWAEVLGLERVGRSDNFFALGGDSILSIRIVSRAQQAGLQLSVRQLFQHQSIAELAAVAEAATAGGGPRGEGSGGLAAPPLHQRGFGGQRERPWHYNQAMLLAAGSPIQGHALSRALAALMEHHDMLRLRYREGQLLIAGEETQRVWMCVDVSELTEGEQSRALEEAAEQAQRSLEL